MTGDGLAFWSKAPTGVRLLSSPPKLGVRSPVFIDDYIPKRWSWGPEKDISGH